MSKKGRYEMNSSNNETRQEGYGNMHGNSVIQAYGNHFFLRSTFH